MFGFVSLHNPLPTPGEPPVAGNLLPSCDKDANVVAQPCAEKTRPDEKNPGHVPKKNLPPPRIFWPYWGLGSPYFLRGALGRLTIQP